MGIHWAHYGQVYRINISRYTAAHGFYGIQLTGGRYQQMVDSLTAE